jgi:hypothetical protein
MFAETGWDVANIGYDVATCDWGSLVWDVPAAFVPFMPAGVTKIGKAERLIEKVAVDPNR